MIAQLIEGDQPTECNSLPVTDICSKKTKVLMAFLALVNFVVIFQGVISCKKRIAGYPLKMWEIILFYVLAFLSLSTGILYCFSWVFIRKQECSYYLIESLPAFIYLLSAYAYMAQSISSLMLQCEMIRENQQR